MNSDCLCAPNKLEESPTIQYAKKYNNDNLVSGPVGDASSLSRKTTDKMANSLYAQTMNAYSSSGNNNGEIEIEAPSTPVQQQKQVAFNDEVQLTPDDGGDSTSSSEAAGAYSKKAMIKLMKEQVDLVRNLTNAQLAQKEELERVKAEKRKLEEERRMVADAKEHGRSTRLNLPTRSTSDNEDSDGRSISTFSRYFTPHKRRTDRTTKYRHPDEAYYARDRANRSRAFSDEAGTQANCDPSLASTIGMPSAIMIDPSNANRTGAFGYNGSNNHYGGQHSPPHRFESPTRDRIEITSIPERNVIPPEELNGNGCLSKVWWFLSRLCTFFIPNILLCCIGRSAGTKVAKNEAKQAWREKVAIFVIMMLSSLAFIGVSGVVPMFLCRETEVFTMVSR